MLATKKLPLNSNIGKSTPPRVVKKINALFPRIATHNNIKSVPSTPAHEPFRASRVIRSHELQASRAKITSLLTKLLQPPVLVPTTNSFKYRVCTSPTIIESDYCLINVVLSTTGETLEYRILVKGSEMEIW